MPLYRPVGTSPVSQGFLGAFAWEAAGYVRTDRPRRGARHRFSLKTEYRLHVHLALDYVCPEGTPVRAFKAGTIAGQGWDSSGAYLVYLRVRRGKKYDVTALYYHLKAGSFRFGVGDKVKKGQAVALSGNTGYSTGPHLHTELIRSRRGAGLSEIYREGVRFDPKPFIDGNALLRDIAP